MIELAGFGCGQCRPEYVEALAFQTLRSVAIADSCKAHDRFTRFRGAQNLDFQQPPVLGAHRPVATQALRRLGEGLPLHLALDAVGCRNCAEKDAELRQAGAWPAAFAAA